MDFGLGLFGDRRLQKGGPSCTADWWRLGNAVLRCARSAAIAPAKCELPGLCATRG